MANKIFILKEDIVSSFKKEVVYGKKGEKVEGVFVYDNVWLVKGKNTIKFPVNVSLLEEVKPQ